MAVLAWSIFIENGTSKYTVPPESSMLANTVQLVSGNYHTLELMCLDY